MRLLGTGHSELLPELSMKLKKYCYPFLICMIALAAWSCNKNGDDKPVVLPTAHLNVINAVTDIRAIDVYLNGTRQNNNSAIYLFNASGYLTVTKGEQQYQFKSDTDRTVLADIKLNTAAKDSSTVVMAGQQSKNTLTAIFLNDNFIADPILKNAKVRFVQASPGTAAYDVAVGDTLSFTNQVFKGTTDFKSVGAGKKVVKVKLAGTATEVFNGTLILNTGSYYTMYLSGEPAGKNKSALNVSVNLSR